MDFQLTKEEIPIWGREMTGFYLPIHPTLLDSKTMLNPKIAKDVFPQVSDEWYDDLTKYLDENPQLGEETKRHYLQFVKGGRPIVDKIRGDQILSTVMGWRDGVNTDVRGFANGLSISRNGGGTIYYNPSMGDNEYHVQLDGKPNRVFRLSREKALSLSFQKVGEDFGKIYVYSSHNVDHFPGALFLRNWGLAYLNAAMTSI